MTRIIVYAAAAAKFNASRQYSNTEPLFADTAPARSPWPILTNAVVIPQKRHSPPAAFTGQTGNRWKRKLEGTTSGAIMAEPEM
jgi:hypothetical protein